MQLIYAYIRKFRCLEGLELTFSPYYNISFDKVKAILDISLNKDFPADFFEDPISSITAIVGKNGRGKTTSIRWLLGALVEGSGEKSPDGIIVCKDNEGKLTVYKGENFRNVKERDQDNLLRKDNSQYSRFERGPKIPCMYYSGHFSPYIMLNVMSSELAGEANISDSWLLLKDLQSYGNQNVNTLHNPIRAHLNAYVVQNNYRIAQLLSSEFSDYLQNILRLPKYISVVPNNSGRERLNLIQKERLKDSGITSTLLAHKDKYQSFRQNVLLRFINEAIINYIAENLNDASSILEIFIKWQAWQGSARGPINDLKLFLQQNRLVYESFYDNLLSVITFIDINFEFYDNDPFGFFYLPVSKSKIVGEWSEMLMMNPVFLTARFFDVTYTVELDAISDLSSGEAEMLNLLSRMYWHLNIETAKFSNLEISSLVFLDEAEIGFHPDWQRKYLKILVEFFNSIAKKIKKRNKNHDFKFQIVYTTHSPVSLSDLPKECVNFLEVNSEDKTVNLTAKMPQTFGENIFELYRNNFFMNKGLIGEMAQEYMARIEKDLNQHGRNINPEELERRINIIGDERLRNYFMSRLESLLPSDDISTRIKILERELEILKEAENSRKKKK